MTGAEYQKAAMRTANPECEKLSNAGLGLAGEAGEVADLIKKHLHQGHELDAKKLMDELGDVMWYVALAAECIGASIDDIMLMNVEKLRARYPDGFDPERSKHREVSEDDVQN